MAVVKKGPQNTAAGDSARPPIRYTSQRCFTIARTTWEWTIASLPFDLLFFSTRPVASFHGGDSDSALAVLLCAAILGVFRESLLQGVAKVRRVRGRLTERQLLIALIAVGVLGSAEVVARLVTNQRRAPLALLAAIAGFIIWKSWRGAGRLKEQRTKFLRDRLAQVEQANILHLAVVLIPVAAARAISLLFAFNAENGSIFALGLTVSLALILALRPSENDFMAPCPRCRRMTSRALIVDQCCPQCRPNKFS